MQTFITTKLSLCLGLLLLIISLATILKVRLGSRLNFAYTVAVFSVGYSLNLITYFFIFAYLTSFYGFFRDLLTFHWFIYKMLSLQSWVFAIQYYQSAITVASHKTMSEKRLKTVKFCGIILYTILMLTLFLWLYIA